MSESKLSISIMAHPKRRRFLPYLFEKLGVCPVSEDTGWGLWENAKRAWKLYEKNAQYHVVIQDDAIICKNFRAEAVKVIEQSEKVFNGRPHILNFYYDRMLIPSNAEEIIKNGYIIRSRVNWAPAICIPVNLIDGMIEFCDKLEIPQDDEKITRFLRNRGLRVYFPIPSLVDHRTDVPSLIGNDNSGERKAWKFLG